MQDHRAHDVGHGVRSSRKLEPEEHREYA